MCGLLCTLAIPDSARAQLGFESLLSGINDVAFTFTCWKTRSGFLRPTSECPSDRSGYGVEILWTLGTIPIRNAAAPDTVWNRTGKQVRYPVSGTEDSTVVFAPKEKSAKDRGLVVSLELGLGYGQFTGFGSRDPGFEILGAVRELPAVTAYGALNGNGLLRVLRPYLGVRSGLIHAHGFQLLAPAGTDSVLAFTGTSQAFQVGASLGVAAGMDGLLLFAEYAYNARRFSSVHWTAPNVPRTPADYPRVMDFSGSSWSVGLQVQVRAPR